jgi:V/A-type H+-transporting ATPase subunit A
MARIVGKDALPPRQQHILLCAELINDAFLRQSAFSDVDRYCSPDRQARMMQLLSRFILLSQQAVEQGVDIELINNLPLLRRLRRMSEDIGEDKLEQYDELRTELENAFATLMKKELSDVG